MFFGFDPFTLIGGNNQQNRRQPGQNQNGINLMNGIGNFLENEFMNFVQPNQQPQQQQEQQQPRPQFFRQGSKKEEKKPEPKAEEVYTEGTGAYWKVKGNDLFKKGEYEAALEMYDKAIQLNNTESVFFANRARCLKILQKHGEALKDAQTAVELDNESVKAHLLCGQILAEIGKQSRDIVKVEKAEKHITRALTLCRNQNKMQFEKQLAVYFYRVKKLNWYLRFEDVKKQRIDSINEFTKYVQNDKELTEEEQKKKIDAFVGSINDQVRFEIPDFLICKITFDMMEDPVTTESGQTYERSAIQQHMERNGKTDPFTRKPINGKLYPSIAIKKAIQDFLEKNPWAYEYSEGQTLQDISFQSLNK